MDGKSPYSTGLCPLSGPLPCLPHENLPLGYLLKDHYQYLAFGKHVSDYGLSFRRVKSALPFGKNIISEAMVIRVKHIILLLCPLPRECIKIAKCAKKFSDSIFAFINHKLDLLNFLLFALILVTLGTFETFAWVEEVFTSWYLLPLGQGVFFRANTNGSN